MNDLTMQQKAEAGWKGAAPDWVQELANMAEARGLKACASRLDYSITVISQTISNKYKGDLTKVEQKVRGALMEETVACPVLGEIGKDACLVWQAKPRAITSAIRAAVYRACRNGCPHSRLKEGK